MSKEIREDFPNEVDINLEIFHKLKRKWKLWRAIGHHDANGSFIAPVDFFQAREIAKEELDFYLDMDNLFSIYQRQQATKEANNGSSHRK